MKPNFALSLSHDGIQLFHRSGSGWTEVGDAALDDPDLTDKLKLLRGTAADLGAGGFSTKLILPDSQILYTTVDAPGPRDTDRAKQIRAALDGLTPYPVEDLVYDWIADNGTARVAVVARETLNEAEAFATEHRFNPVCFVARPDATRFPSEPFFGQTVFADSFLSRGEVVERDGEIARSSARRPAPPAAKAPKPQPPTPAPPRPRVQIPATPAPATPAKVPLSKAPPPPPPQVAAAAKKGWARFTSGDAAKPPEIAGLAPAADPAKKGWARFKSAATAPAGPATPPAEDKPAAKRGWARLLGRDKAATPADAASFKSAPAKSGLAAVGSPATPKAAPPASKPAKGGFGKSAPAQAASPSPSSADAPPSFSTRRKAGLATASGTSGTTSQGLAQVSSRIGMSGGAAGAAAVASAPPLTARAPDPTPANTPDPALRPGAAVPDPVEAPRPKPRLTAETDPFPLPPFDKPGAKGAFKDRAPKVAMPKVALPRIETPKIRMPAFKAPSFKAAGLKAQALKVPKLKAPDVSGLTGLAGRIAPAMASMKQKASAVELPSRPKPTPAKDRAEEEAMTLFGARGQTRKGPPKYLGLMLTGGLLGVMALVAVGSILFLGDRDTATTETAAATTEAIEPAPPLELDGTSAITPGAILADTGRPAPTPEPEVTAAPLPVPEAETPPAPVATETAVPAETPAEDTAPPPALADADPPAQTDGAPPETAGTLVETDSLPGTIAIGEDVLELALSDDAVPPAAETAPPAPAAPAAPAPAEAPPTLREPFSRADAETYYASRGIWALDPEPSDSPGTDRLDDFYITSIDPVIVQQDAIALPQAPTVSSDGVPQLPAPPPPPGVTFDLDERGLVRATPEGALTPSGVTVTAGPPPVTPRPRPDGLGPEIVPPVPDERLRGIRPIPRPENLIETNERGRFGGLSRTELADIRPEPRPLSAPQQADAAPVTTGTGATGDDTATETDLAAAEPEVDIGADATALAVLASLQPPRRPDSIAARVEEAREEAAPVEPPAPDVATAVIPTLPTTASVAREATETNAINLGKVNLIGVYGSSNDRRALVRMPSGRYVKVEVGDRLDGGQVAAIGDDQLRYIKGGRNITLQLPRS